MPHAAARAGHGDRGWRHASRRSRRGQTPKRGGILTSMIIEDPPGFSIHESATVSTVWPMMPCYSNLVLFDQREGARDGGHRRARAGRAVVVAGQPSEPRLLPAEERAAGTTASRSPRRTSSTPSTSCARRQDAPAKLRLSPRKDWFANVEAIETPTPTRWSFASSGRSPRCSSCSPPDTRRSIRPTCPWPTCASAAWAPAPSSSRSTSAGSGGAGAQSRLLRARTGPTSTASAT